MTYQIAHSAGMDAANKYMRLAGRTTWNEEDADLAVKTFNQLYPLCAEYPGIEAEMCGCARCTATD